GYLLESERTARSRDVVPSVEAGERAIGHTLIPLALLLGMLVVKQAAKGGASHGRNHGGATFQPPSMDRPASTPIAWRDRKQRSFQRLRFYLSDHQGAERPQ